MFLPRPMPKSESDVEHLRVLIANEKRDRLELLAQVVIGLGHDVIARDIYVEDLPCQVLLSGISPPRPTWRARLEPIRGCKP
jgi:hypothetical protein